MDHPQNAQTSNSAVEDVIITDELARRPSHAPDYKAANAALVALAQELTANPRKVLQKVAELVLQLCHADSAGIGALEQEGGQEVFRWLAAAGDFAPHLNGTIPRAASPCGTVVARNQVLLCTGVERAFPALRGLQPRMYENLLVPWEVNGHLTGTVWAIKHTPDSHFDAEDARLLGDFARFAGAAYALMERTHRADARAAERIAALNLMEDAILARQETELAYDSLRESEEKYHTLFDSIDEAVIVNEMIFNDEGRAVDFRLLEANQVYERQTGLTDAVGKLQSEIVPRLEPYWLEGYERVALTGEPWRIENYSVDLGRWYQAYVSRIGGNGSPLIAVVFDDITERKNQERRQEFLLKFADALRPLADPIALQEVAVRMLGTQLGVDRCYYAEFDWPSDVLYIHHEYTRTDAVSAIGAHPISLFNDLLVHSHKGEPLVCDDITTHPVFGGEAAAYRERGTDAFILMPLVKQGTMVACMCVTMETARHWSAAEIALVKEVAERTWTAVERARVEAALHESEARFRTLTDAVPQVIWANEAGGKANYFNQRWFDYSGLSLEASVGPGWQAIVHPDDAPASVERWNRALAAGEIFDTEYRLRRADGVYRWFIGRNVPLKDEGGQVLGWFGSATDIEDMKQANAALRESEERFRVLVEGSQDYAIFLMDTERRILYWNSGAERIFGHRREQTVGQSGDMIFTPEDIAAGAPEREIQTALREGRAADTRWHVRGDGSRFWAEGIMARLGEESDGVRGFVKIMRDATRERQAEEELRRAHDELEQRVQERTAALRAEAQQRQAAERAREQLLQRLVTAQEEERQRISRELHDQMGQQLTALLMGLNALPEPDDPGARPPSQPQQLEVLRKLTTDLMEQMHHLAWELRPAALDTLGLGPALHQYVQEWRQQNKLEADFVSRGVANRERLSSALETTMYRVVQEALTNVVRHAQAQRVSVLLERNDSFLIAIVEDDGRGFQVETATDGRLAPVANRLGLLGMQERIELLGGTLTIESAPHQGTTVYARVPV
ncbi:MAG: PAS domain S-box protein [Abitibacteriaceae bacterium]|nr:PAS domain S-box protein [Acidobacteriaceae bacterium]MBV9868953.1 PAS domain S-box protein [Abditibacteriaceae bacterium]